MRRASRAVVVAVSFTCLGLALSRSAAAQDKEADAERLFREGQALMEQRRFGEACPKFEAAYAKDRQLGTLLNLAFCHKEQGATWYAWLEFREAEVKAAELKRTERRDFARERLNELERSLPKVVLDNPRKLLLTDVLVEDRRVPEAERGAVFTSEEGKRKFTFRAKGKKSATVLVSIGPKVERAQHVAVPEMEEGEDEAPPKPQPQVIVVPAPAPPPPRPADADASRAGSAQRTIGFAALGVAGAAVVVGGVTGMMTLTNACANNFIHDKSDACTQSDRDSADATSTVATISFVVAGAAATGGLVLLLTSPSRASAATARPRVRPELGLGWAGLRGAF